MRIVFSTLAVILGLAAPSAASAAGYTITPLVKANGLGTFLPSVLLDSGEALGTLYPTGVTGSVGLAAAGWETTELNYCGPSGAADRTQITAASTDPAIRYVVGTCGQITSFLHDNAAGTTLRINYNLSDTTVAAVSAGGIAAGEYYDGNTPHGFTYSSSGYSAFDPPSSSWTSVAGITALGTVFGYYITTSDLYGFLFDRSGHYTTIQVPTADFTTITGMNSHGQATGVFSRHSSVTTAFEWKAGHFTMFPLTAAVSSNATAINEKGVVAGTYLDASSVQHAFAWLPRTGGIFSFDLPPGADRLFVTGVNNHHAQITGYYTLATATVSFVANCSGRCF